jgi:hypothetical protein
MTPAQFKALKPQFVSVPDVRVQSYLNMAARIVFDPDDQDAMASLTCHFMTLDGLGTDATSKSFATGAASYQSIKSGQLTLTRFQKAAGEGTSYQSWLGQTPCGQFYALLLKMARGGPRVARGGPSRCITAYAKDGWPLWVDNGYPV